MVEVVGQRVMTVNLLDYTNKYGEKVLFLKNGTGLKWDETALSDTWPQLIAAKVG